MARPATSPAARLRELAKALAKAQTMKRGETLTAFPMAELLGVSWVTLQNWCSEIEGFEASKAFERGARGIEWTFRPVATVRFLIKHFEGLRAASAKRAERHRKIAAGNDLDGAPSEMGLDELTKLIRLNTELQAIKERSGKLVDADKAATAILTYHTAMQQAVMRAAQEQDPSGTLPPELREKFENATRTILLRMEQAGQACLSELRGAAALTG